MGLRERMRKASGAAVARQSSQGESSVGEPQPSTASAPAEPSIQPALTGFRATMQRRQELQKMLATTGRPQPAAPLPLPATQPSQRAAHLGAVDLADRRFRPIAPLRPAAAESEGLPDGPEHAAAQQAPASPPPPAIDAAVMDGIDRGAARAAVVLGFSPHVKRDNAAAHADDIFDFDGAAALRAQQAVHRATGRAPRARGVAGEEGEGSDDPPTAAKEKRPRRRGALVKQKPPAEAAAAAAEGEEAMGLEWEPGAAVADTRERKKRPAVAARDRGEGTGRGRAGAKRSGGTKRRAGLAAAEGGEEEGEEEEGAERSVNAALLSTLDTLIQAGGGAEGRSRPGSAAGTAPAPVAPAAPLARPNLANAPQDGPDEDLVLRVDEEGNFLELGEREDELHLELSVPASINKYLRGYQREGVRFLFRQYARGQGGILADDMGLGKTVQCVAFCAAVLGKTGVPEEDAFEPALHPLNHVTPPEAGEDLELDDYEVDLAQCFPILIVCPTVVVKNWEREFNNWGSFRVTICHGKTRDTAMAAIMKGEKEVMITTPGMFMRLVEDICAIPWHLVFWDEAHQLKNERTATYKAAVRLPTRLRFGLTGTPMQNDYAELWCLMNWAAPGALGDRASFKSETEVAMKMGNRTDATLEQIEDARAAQAQLGADLSQVLLRRTKALIAHQMPAKRDHIVFCQLADLQLAAYMRVLASPDCQLLVNYGQPCPCGSRKRQLDCCYWRCLPEEGGVLWPMYHLCECDNAWEKYANPDGCKSHKPEGCWVPRIINDKFCGMRRNCPFCLALPVCGILRKISNHIEMVKADLKDQERDPLKFQRDEQVAHLALGEDAGRLGGLAASSDFLRLSDAQYCGKLVALEALLATWKAQPGSNKVLLFSMSVRLLQIVKSLVTFKGYDYLLLDGSTPMQERQKLVDEFNARPSIFIFLISTTAGGVGLNLTAANKVIILDPSWNPSHDLQAQDRAFRIGQKRDVDVYRLVAAGTIEEMIYSRQIYKQQHSNMAIQGLEETSYFAGAKGVRGEQGELWGLMNLLKLESDRVNAKDRIEQRAAQLQYRIEEVDLEAAAEAAGEGGGSGTGQQGDGGRRRAPRGTDEEEGLDSGLEELLGPVLGEEGHEADGANGTGPSAAAAAGRGGGQEGLEEGEDSEEGDRAERDVLAQAGVVLLRHDAHVGCGPVVAPNYAPQPEPPAARAAKAAAARAAAAGAPKRQKPTPATAGAGSAAAPQPTAVAAAPPLVHSSSRAGRGGNSSNSAAAGRLSAVESLAAWQGIEPAEMARQLLAMAPEQRAALRDRYVAEAGVARGPA